MMQEKKFSKKHELGSWLERALFHHRALFLLLFAVLTLVLGYQMIQLRPEASFLRMIPTYHPYIQNYLEHEKDLKGLGNTVRVSVETTEGDIFDAEYLEVLRKVTDDVFFISGVDRPAVKSLWTPVTRWTEVTEEGFAGGPVIQDTYDGSPTEVRQMQANVFKSGEIGTLVANDLKSSIVFAPLRDLDPETGEPLDYKVFAEKLEEIRTKYQNDKIKIHITGFAKVVGDLIEGANRVVIFFGIAFVILLVFLYLNGRCARSTAVRAVSSLVAVVWQLGLLKLFGYGLNPYSMLVPFLMFALGVSHGIQMNNAMAHELMNGSSNLWAARRAYRKVYVPGLAALLTDGIGFATLLIIGIGVIQDIAVGASIGVGVVAFTDLMLLPIMMSYVGMSSSAVARMKAKEEQKTHPVWRLLANLTKPKAAAVVILVSALGLAGGWAIKQDIKVGDLDAGAPELRPDSRYNLDSAYMTDHYSASSDVFVVMLKTPLEGNSNYGAVVAVDQLRRQLEELPGVQGVVSYVEHMKRLNSALSEGNLKWLAVPRSPAALDNLVMRAPSTLVNTEGTMAPIVVYLNDHKAETLENVVALTEKFAAENNNEDFEFLLAAGNAGIEAATNIEIAKAHVRMTAFVYAVVFLVCLITYRSWRGAVCVVVPLFLTSVLCEALMTKLGIGIKVATLPVIAVGVGIGVDYGIYIYNKLRAQLELGEPLVKAYYNTLRTTGTAVAFTGVTLGIGVGTWVFSPIKFQADMGILLTFMFVWNMVGALVLLPALACWLLKKPDSDKGHASKTDQAVA